MAQRITAISSQDGPASEFRLFQNGAQIGAVIAATYVGAGTYAYFADVPGTVPAGPVSFALYRTSNARLRAAGEFYWNGTDIVYAEELNIDSTAVEAAVVSALTAENIATAPEVSAAQAAIAALIAGLNDITAADVEAELFNDGTGDAFRAGLAQTFEAALANDADGNASGAVFQAAVTAALNAYQAATQGDVSTAEANVITALPTPSDATLAKQDQILADIAALNNLSAADVLAQATTAANNYDAATASALTQAVTDIQNSISSGAGLTTAQAAQLTFIRDVAEADEVYTPTSAQKLLKGTSTVLVDKDVTTDTECDVNTSLIQAP